MPDAFSSLLPQRAGNYGASAASRIADVLSMAQAAVRKEKQRAAATPAPAVISSAGPRGAMRGRCVAAAAGSMRGVHAVAGRRAKSAGAAQQRGIATSPFVTAGAHPNSTEGWVLIVFCTRKYPGVKMWACKGCGSTSATLQRL